MGHFTPSWAPQSALPAERRGVVVGRFCRECASFYPLHAALHKGKPSFGRDHVSSPCSSEGRAFDEGATWWEPAVAVLAPVATVAPVAPLAPGVPAASAAPSA